MGIHAIWREKFLNFLTLQHESSAIYKIDIKS